MKNNIRKSIQKKLQNDRIALNSPDASLPQKIATIKKVAVIGAGIAGISAAANLSERGFQVDLYEKNDYLGGKLGAWKFQSNGETLEVEHGFHAFFRQYYNLRDFMQRVGIFENLITIDDYIIWLKNGEKYGFKDVDKTPGLNILSMYKQKLFPFYTFLNPLSAQLLSLFRFDMSKTHEKWDGKSFEDFAKRTLMPKKMQLVFATFARAFFSSPDKISLAELMKGFHFYFLGNEQGLIYEVLNDDFATSFLQPCENYLQKNGVTILKNNTVDVVEKTEGGFLVKEKMYDYCVLACDVPHVKRIVKNSQSLRQTPIFHKNVQQLEASGTYAVWRIWTDSLTTQTGLPFFIFTERLQCLDSITLYHQMEKTSRRWSEKNNGGIYELHSYALPEQLKDEETIKKIFLEELFHYFPELKGMHIKHEYFQLKDDFPCFGKNKFAHRPTVKTDISGLYLAGDWVRMHNTSMLMEAAYTSGALAANEIMYQEKIQENALFSVPNKGILA